jgi:hypothetical protein
MPRWDEAQPRFHTTTFIENISRNFRVVIVF